MQCWTHHPHVKVPLPTLLVSKHSLWMVPPNMTTHYWILFWQVLLLQLPWPTDDFPCVSATHLPTFFLPLCCFLIILWWHNWMQLPPSQLTEGYWMHIHQICWWFDGSKNGKECFLFQICSSAHSHIVWERVVATWNLQRHRDWGEVKRCLVYS